jgi:hypothetical protein
MSKLSALWEVSNAGEDFLGSEFRIQLVVDN